MRHMPKKLKGTFDYRPLTTALWGKNTPHFMHRGKTYTSDKVKNDDFLLAKRTFFSALPPLSLMSPINPKMTLIFCLLPEGIGSGAVHIGFELLYIHLQYGDGKAIKYEYKYVCIVGTCIATGPGPCHFVMV